MMHDDGRKGRIVTFYSYKGGTGRSMALANVAWILASNGQRVLAVDWDLEAPGLHRYFLPFLVDRELASSPGVIDFVFDYTLAAMTPPETEGEPEKDWYLPYTNILRYAVSLDWRFPGSGRLDFIPAGRQSESYSARVNSFNWQDFFTRLGGRAFLEAVKEKMRAEYDFVLIDSRTGVSDSSGICTVQMPDVLVVCHTLNNQSIRGAASVAASVRDQRQASPVRILVVPMRIENAEKDKRDLRREEALATFSSLGIPVSSRIQFPYIPYYAYEEILSTFGDAPDDTGTFLESAERLTGLITEGRFSHLQVSSERLNRKAVLESYAKGKALPELSGVREPSGFEALLSNLRDSWRQVRSILRRPLVAYGLILTLAIALPVSVSSELEKVRRQNDALRMQLAAATGKLRTLEHEPQPLRFEVIHAQRFWLLGGTQAVDHRGQPIDFVEYLKRSGLRDRLADYDSVITVGLSSCEGDRHVEDLRAQERADQLRLWLSKTLSSMERPDLYSLNLGRFAGRCSEESSLEQRRIFFVGMDVKRSELRESLKIALQKSSAGLDIDNYTSFDLVGSLGGGF
jgi:MinD-like ATPase involved in chromosome partitioning or flagellar assembly